MTMKLEVLILYKCRSTDKQNNDDFFCLYYFGIDDPSTKASITHAIETAEPTEIEYPSYSKTSKSHHFIM